MSKEELKEMIDSVIVSNGNGQITGNTLNQVLNAIAENAGGGSGFPQVYECYRSGFSGDSAEYHGDDENRRQNNIEVFNKINAVLEKIWNNLDNDEDIDPETQKEYIQNAKIYFFKDSQIHSDCDNVMKDISLYTFEFADDNMCSDEFGNKLNTLVFTHIENGMPFLHLCEDGSVFYEYYM